MAIPSRFASDPRMLVRRTLILGGLSLLALVAGHWLGRYTVAGLAMGSGAQEEYSSLSDYVRDRGLLPVAPPTFKPVPVVSRYESHICEGCDAHIGRESQLARVLGIFDVEARDGGAMTDEWEAESQARAAVRRAERAGIARARMAVREAQRARELITQRLHQLPGMRALERAIEDPPRARSGAQRPAQP